MLQNDVKAKKRTYVLSDGLCEAINVHKLPVSSIQPLTQLNPQTCFLNHNRTSTVHWRFWPFLGRQTKDVGVPWICISSLNGLIAIPRPDEFGVN